jgi:hypothetical protein
MGYPNVKVVGQSKLVTDITAVSAGAAYTAGDYVGALRVLALGRVPGVGGVILGLTVIDRGNQKAALEIFLFNTAPQATVADNAAANMDEHYVEFAGLIGRVSVAAADYKTVAGSYTATIPLAIGFASATGNVWAVVVTTGTPTYVATTDLRLNWNVVQD